jgi:anionic cell wall polymer biosynthesis LytR-Cps2A-Psr (LCP) family protein
MDNIVICVMDRNEYTDNTDIIIVVNPNLKQLMWVPRDIYSNIIKERINAAYREGEEELLLECLNDIGFDIQHVICLLPNAIEQIFNYINTITVPVDTNRKLYYPLHRHKPIEEGKRIVEFNRPYEILSGDRFHEWIGARTGIKTQKYEDTGYYKHNLFGSDIDRIFRQQILIKQILLDNIDFNDIYINTEFGRGINIDTINILKTIDNSWTFDYIKNYKGETVNNQRVLVIQ